MSEPSAIQVAYYADDFTGATDVMEALTIGGVKTVLFLRPPTPQQLGAHPSAQAFGIAGGSRAMSPTQMDAELPPAFEALKASGAPLVHYKICSTFDSSPQVGSIGKAIELGRRVFGDAPTPLAVGAPVLGRYVAFGNLFARSGLDSEPARLDRHPTMRCHPVTPMHESDLRVHLSRQTDLPIHLVDVLRLKSGDLQSLMGTAGKTKPAPILLFDTIDETHLERIGDALQKLASTHSPIFCVGSSGLEYALAAYRRGSRTENPHQPKPNRVPARCVIAVSGSCSPVTQRQMARAAEFGYSLMALSPTLFTQTNHSELEGIIRAAAACLARGQSVILHSSEGPDDPRIAALSAALNPQRPGSTGASIGSVLGTLLAALAPKTPGCRLVVCGGDTSTEVAHALAIEALEFAGPMAPGSPLCRIHAPREAVHGMEVVFKGGQVGRDDFFQDVLAGGPPDPMD